MAGDKVVFNRAGAKRIVDAVRYVEDLQNPEPPEEEEVVETEIRRILKGTYSGVWRHATSKTVSFVADDGTVGTRTATNYGPDVNGGACVIVLAGGAWLLVWSAPPEYQLDVTVPSEGSGGGGGGGGVTSHTVVTDVSASGSISYVSGVSANGSATYVTDVTRVASRTVDVVSAVTASGSNPYVQHISGTGSKTFLTDATLSSSSVVTAINYSGPSEVVTGVSCVDGNLHVTTASISVTPTTDSLSITTTTDSVSFSDLASFQSDNMELGDLATISTTTIEESDVSVTTDNLNVSVTPTYATFDLSNSVSVTTGTLDVPEAADAANGTFMESRTIKFYGPYQDL